MAGSWIRSLIWKLLGIDSANDDYLGPGDYGVDVVNKCREVIAKSKQRLHDSSMTSCEIMNKNQCVLLSKKLSETEDTLAESQQSSISAERTRLALQELHQAMLDADRLIQSSCVSTSDWFRAALEQGDMKETFARALYEVQWHTEVLDSILVDGFGDDSGRSTRSSFDSARWEAKLTARDEFRFWTAVKEDLKALKDRLRSVKLDEAQRSDPAHQLLENLKAVIVEDQVDGKEGNSAVHLLCLNPTNPKGYDLGRQLGTGSSGAVRVAKFLGGEYAMKIFWEVNPPDFDQEMAALQQLGRHPHIVRLFCYSKNKDCFLIMEKMDMDLFEYLKQREEAPSHDHAKRILEAVVLMLQVAEGVKYIHSKGMAHRDLKPGNVLVTVEDQSSRSLSRALSVKIADFGLTKTRDTSKTYANQTLNIGTSKYMAPEVIRAPGDPNTKAKLNPRKADSYSFAIMCSEILTGEEPFGDLGRNPTMLKKEVKQDKRPILPEHCPQRLKSLIQKCWAGNFHTRPYFPEICRELRFIKALLLRGDQQMLDQTFITDAEKVTHLSQTHLTANLVGLWHTRQTKQHQFFSEQSSSSSDNKEQFSPVPASAKAIRQGPWGRDEPSKTTGLFDHVADGIKWIRLKYQHSPPGVGLMEVGYVSGGKESRQAYCDGVIGTTWRKIDFEPDEYIKQISGSVAPHEVTVKDRRGKVGLISVVSLTIHTNRRSYGPFGDETTGRRFRSGTGMVFGFFGAGSILLDKLGVSIIPDGQDGGDQSFLIEQ